MKEETTLTKADYFPLRWVIPLLAFSLPLLVSGPQLLTGTLVNCLLFLAASSFSRRDQAAIAIAPSIGAILNGLLFGSFTPFLAYFLPMIWIGNIILMNTYLALENRRVALRIIVPAFLKSAFLFLFALIFFKLGLVPRIFLTAMGILQFGTALVGGVLFLSIRKITNKI